jgi:uncharacterized membrane protein
MFKKLIRYFVRGTLVLVPLGATIYVVYFTITTVDQLFAVSIPGLGVVLAVGLITLVGFLTSNVVGRSMFDATEHVFRRVPLVKLLYVSIKDLVSAFMGQTKRFTRPVAVRLSPGNSLLALGFITRDALRELDLGGHVAVYFPQSYNFAGNLVLVPEEQVIPLEAPSGEVLTFIVSGGISGLGVGHSLPPPPPSL